MKVAELFATLINSHLADRFSTCAPFAGSRLLGIADNVFRKEREGSFPVIYDENGEGTYVGVDDIEAMILYHRILNIAFAQDPASYGDKENQRATFTMRMAVYGDRKRLHMTGDELGMFIHTNMPGIIKNVPNFGTIIVRTTSIVPNNTQAFNNEYQRVPFFLKPEHMLINVNYTIESKIKKDCFNLCPV